MASASGPQATTLALQVFSDSAIMAIVMDKIIDPPTLLSLVLTFSSARAIYERYPRTYLAKSVSALPSEIKQIAVAFLAVRELSSQAIVNCADVQASGDHKPPPAQDYRAAAESIVLKDQPDTVLAMIQFLDKHLGSTDQEFPSTITYPAKTLRKLADLWRAIDHFTTGFADSSLSVINRANEVHLLHGNPTSPQGFFECPCGGSQCSGHLAFLWDPSISHFTPPLPPKKPQPWELPLRDSEIYRLKRALWRIELVVLAFIPRIRDSYSGR